MRRNQRLACELKVMYLGKGDSCGEQDVEDCSFEVNVLALDRPVLVYFWATWCGPCKLVSPVVSAIAGKFHGGLEVHRMDVSCNRVTPRTYEVTTVPTIVLFVRGLANSRLVGAVSESQLMKWLSANGIYPVK